MAKLRILVQRRKAVRNIRKITRTMELIAATRFRRAMDRALSAEAYTRKIAEIAADLTQTVGEVTHPLLQVRIEIKKSLVLILCSNRGLCGGYNASIIRDAMLSIREFQTRGIPVDLELVGRRAVNYFKYLSFPIKETYLDFEDKPAFAQVEPIGNHLIDLYTSGQVDQISVAYMKFYSAGRQKPIVETLLPLSALAPTDKPAPTPSAVGIEYDFLPSATEILQEIVPAAFKARLFKCFLDAAVSEQIARRVAMKSATENAGDLIKSISRQYNRARQANITKEISELIAGSEALK